MWTGRQTLASIEDAIARLQGEEGHLDQALHSAISDGERLRAQRGQALRELARIKLDEMTAGRLVGNLDAGERRAVQILEAYRLRVAAVVEQREALLKEVGNAEAERHVAAAAVETALNAVEHLRAEAEAKVRDIRAWRDAKAARDQAESVAVQAEKKAAASQAELEVKRKPYDEDPLFAYLWRRRFGTPQYAGGALTRRLDRMVARFIGYDSARPNYAALIEIPLRLKGHASAKREVVTLPQAALAEIEHRVMVETGVDAKEKILAEVRHKLAAIDDTAEKKRDMLRRVNEARDTLVAGSADPAYNEALSTISAADAEDSLATLYAEARRTTTSADDAIVSRLEATEVRIAKTDTEIADLRRQALELSRRRSEIERVRERFRDTGYDHPQISFDNDGDIAKVLKGMLEGAVRSGVLWDLLRHGQRSLPTRGSTDFGAPQFPLPFPLPGGNTNESTGGAWRDPSTRGGWSPLPGPEPSSDDEEFRTGGTF
jgi:hypothetical protein